MNVKKAIGITLSIIVGLAFLSVGLSSYAGERTAKSLIDKNISFTITDKQCEVFPGFPDGAPLKAARAFDASSGETIYGCALDYGKHIEFQLISSDKKKHYQFVLPSSDFHVVDAI